MITNNVVNQVDNDIVYQDVHEVHNLHVMLNIDADVYDDTLVDMNSISEEVDIGLLNEPDLDENSDNTYISTDNEYDSGERGLSGDLGNQHFREKLTKISSLAAVTRHNIRLQISQTSRFERRILVFPLLAVLHEERSSHASLDPLRALGLLGRELLPFG
ncbi:hypothetical protein VNO77_08685 [Canavalia gladiata]|uniref:Uncharacterized protein n=1 Tax=Canavalia gladiata TaxID=3824 RepID=A0AAN9M9H6_CANGL